jgi:hypothetical protein
LRESKFSQAVLDVNGNQSDHGKLRIRFHHISRE